jgi:hypothetical protein
MDSYAAEGESFATLDKLNREHMFFVSVYW